VGWGAPAERECPLVPQGARSKTFFCATLSTMFKTSVSHPLSSIASPPFSDAPGTTVGKGFTGVMKKWGFKGQGASHGNSKAHRKAGGIGACQDPGKVWPGKKMAGRSGAVRRTVLSLRVAGVDADRGLVYLAGAVPGGAGSPVRVSDAVLARHGGRQPVARPFPTQL
jgi:large subunit ribosomal protein L3